MTSAGYSTEVPYLRTFSNDLAPQVLRLVAALNGFAPPPGDDFDYCEIGSGTGDNAVTLAAANPQARFLGVDVSPEHVKLAKGLAMRGGVENAAFLLRDFEAIGKDEVPDFDYVCVHGLLTWVSPEKRRALIDFCSARLKPGGLLYVGYNALPGWAGLAPLRRLIQNGAAAAQGAPLQKAAAGLALAKTLSDAGAGYFADNPTAKSMIDTMSKAGLPYVVHEYLQPHWHPMYFADVVREMGDRDLAFVGQLPLHLNYRNLALGPVLVELSKDVHDRLVYENLKDFALNELFRRDVFVKGWPPRSEEATREYLETTVFGSLTFPDRVKRQVPLPHTTLDFEKPVFESLIPALGERAWTLSDLSGVPGLAGAPAERLREAMLFLLLGDLAFPMREPTLPAGRPHEGMYRLGLPYNQMVVNQKMSPQTPIVLAVPAAGAGLSLTMLDTVCLRLLTQVEEAARPAWIRGFVEQKAIRLAVRDKAVDTPDEQARVLEAELAGFCKKRLPKLRELGILEKVS